MCWAMEQVLPVGSAWITGGPVGVTSCPDKKREKQTMLARTTRIAAMALGLLGGVVLTSLPAGAGSFVELDLSAADFGFTVSSSKLMVSESAGSDFTLRLMDDGTIPQIRDTAKIFGGDDFVFSMDLTLLDGVPGDNSWTAIGTLLFTDIDTDPASGYAVMGDFASTSITFMGGGVGFLMIEGRLTPTAGYDSVLQNRGDEPWVFVGEEAVVGKLDEDGTAGQISVYNRAGYDLGQVVLIKMGVDAADLDDVFSGDRVLDGGVAKGPIVPEPATLALLMLGGVAMLAGRHRVRG